MPSTGKILAAFTARLRTLYGLIYMGSRHDTQEKWSNMRSQGEVGGSGRGQAVPAVGGLLVQRHVAGALVTTHAIRWLISTIVANHRASTVTCGAGFLRLQRKQPSGREA